MSAGTSRERIERLVRATPGLIGEPKVERMLARVVDLARDLLEARYSAIGLLAPDNQTLATFTTSGLTEDQRRLLGDNHPVGRGVLGLVIRERRIVRLPDLREHPASIGFPEHHPEMRSFLGVPIVGREGVLGDLYLTEKLGAAEFTDEDVQIGLLLASIVASAVENARFHEGTARLLEEVQQLQRSRERFFAMVNHELRNALAAVYGWAEIQVRRKSADAVPSGALEILEAAEQAIGLVNDLLDLNRLDEDRLRPVFKDVDCGGLIRATALRARPALEEKQLTLALPDGDRALVSRTDGHRVEQILVNVLSNAIRHTPPKGTITIGAEAVGASVEITLNDEGPGVAPEDKERIFDIYYTASSEAGQTGHGVGLPLSRRLARLLGGDLTAEIQPGRGGKFVLRLPRSES